MRVHHLGLAALAALLLAPLSASALGLVIENIASSGASTTVLNPGETITFDLRLENPTNENVNAMSLAITGYEEGLLNNTTDNHLLFVGSTASAFALDRIIEPLPGVFTQAGDGLANSATTGHELGDPLVPGGNVSQKAAVIFNGIRFDLSGGPTGATGDGLEDLGINGLQTGPGGDVHIQVTFLAQALPTPGTITLDMGTGYNGNEALDGTSILAFTNAQHTLTIVPEPGTALLMGLGLAGLAGTRRR